MKILLVTSRYPWPPRRGDQLRAEQMLEMLAPDHDLTLLAPAPGPDAPAPPAGRSYEVRTYRRGRATALAGGFGRALAAGLPLESALFHHPDLTRRLRELAPRMDLCILQLARLVLHLEDVGATPLLVDLIDSLSLNIARRAACHSLWLRPPLLLEAHLLARAERRLTAGACRVLVVSERDRQAIAGHLPPTLAGRLAVVPLALTLAPVMPPGGQDPPAGGPLLAITGNLGYFVNVDAVTWWLREVWPGLHASSPAVRLEVAGDRPARALRRA
ncbi:MAG: hypothetical protein M3O15_05125, partial [Acidobacteriota bacterium]|nr:hypothetical protein [Acidobacteriota bacterium]